MRHLMLVIGLVFLYGCTGSNEVVVGNKTTMEISPKIYEAGEVIKGETVTAKFTIKNTGKYPLVLGEVKGSCSCTVADYPEDPIPPGETGEILAHVNTNDIGVGPINKGVNIVANTEESVTTVAIHGSVMRK